MIAIAPSHDRGCSCNFRTSRGDGSNRIAGCYTILFHQSHLLGRARVAHDTLAIEVERPHDFNFHPGQYVDLTVPNLTDRDALGPIRSLSMASAPAAENLEFIMRLRDTAFKRALTTMPVGSDLLLEGPLDDLVLDHNAQRKQVFIAGGVGIAPFLSRLRQAASDGADVQATLFYSNRRPEDAAFLEELLGLEREIPYVRMVATMTRMAESSRDWSGETDRLGVELLERYLPSIIGPFYTIVGAPTLTNDLKRALSSAGVPTDSVAIEIYEGY